MGRVARERAAAASQLMGLLLASLMLCFCSHDHGGDSHSDAAPDADVDVETGPPDADRDGPDDGGEGFSIEPCGTTTPGAYAGCVDRDRYLADLELVAAARPPGSDHWQIVQDLCAHRLAELGYEVERHDYGTGVNVVGTRAGATVPEEQVLISGHYDHIPGCPGADDNGSGVAAVLEIARVLALGSHDRTTTVACWDEEELGLIGSDAYATRAFERGDSITIAYVLDCVGYTDDRPGTQQVPEEFTLFFPELVAELEANDNRASFIVILADEYAHEPAELLSAYADASGCWNGIMEVPAMLKNSPAAADLRASDHASFWQYDYPSILLNDTTYLRYPAYHCRDGQDVVENLDHEFAAQVIQGTVGSAVSMLAGGG